jgi:hypothetical protein
MQCIELSSLLWFDDGSTTLDDMAAYGVIAMSLVLCKNGRMPGHANLSIPRFVKFQIVIHPIHKCLGCTWTAMPLSLKHHVRSCTCMLEYVFLLPRTQNPIVLMFTVTQLTRKNTCMLASLTTRCHRRVVVETGNACVRCHPSPVMFINPQCELVHLHMAGGSAGTHVGTIGLFHQ